MRTELNLTIQTKKEKKEKDSWVSEEDGYSLWSTGFISTKEKEKKKINCLIVIYVAQKI